MFVINCGKFQDVHFLKSYPKKMFFPFFIKVSILFNQFLNSMYLKLQASPSFIWNSSWILKSKGCSKGSGAYWEPCEGERISGSLETWNIRTSDWSWKLLFCFKILNWYLLKRIATFLHNHRVNSVIYHGVV